MGEKAANMASKLREMSYDEDAARPLMNNEHLFVCLFCTFRV